MTNPAEEVGKARRQKLRDTCSLRDQARLACQRGRTATSWMHVLPSRQLHTSLSNAEFLSIARFWLGLSLFACPQAFWPCPSGCGQLADLFGDHFLCCPNSGISERHNGCRDFLFDVCIRAGVNTPKEQGCSGKKRQADLLLKAWDKGRDCAVDLTVEHPLAPSRWPLKLSAVTSVLRAAEARKITESEGACLSHGWDYTPAAFSPWGMAGPSAFQLITEITRKATGALSGQAKIKRANEIAQGLSLAMVRQVARQLKCRYDVMADIGDGQHAPPQASARGAAPRPTR